MAVGTIGSVDLCSDLSDRDRALGVFKQWIANQKIVEVEFREQRLLTAVAHRFGRDLADLPQYDDLVKLQRQLWTTSSMSVATGNTNSAKA